MNVHIEIPMPDEAYLRRWERGIVREIGRGPSFLVRDPAFIPREPNPTVRISTEDGQMIYAELAIVGTDPGYVVPDQVEDSVLRFRE